MTAGLVFLIFLAVLFFMISMFVFSSSIAAGMVFLGFAVLFAFIAYNSKKKYDDIPVPEAEASAKGYNGIVLFENDVLTISRKGFSGFQGESGDMTIPLKSLVYVKLKKPYMSNGFIQFITAGSPEITDITKAVNSASCVIITSEQYEKFVAFKEIVEVRIASLNETDDDEDDSVSDLQADIIETIEKLSELKDKGIISEEEFQEKKKDLLNKL